MIQIIAAVADNNVIGKDGRIPWDLPVDLAHFKALTTGHTVIMGRKTFESIGHILPDRENIIVSSTIGEIANAVIVGSLQEGIEAASNDEIFIIGGARLYEEALPFADLLYITRVHFSPEGDTYFPFVNWDLYDVVAYRVYDGSRDSVPDCSFITYRKKQ